MMRPAVRSQFVSVALASESRDEHSNVHHDRPEFVQAVRVAHAVGGVEQAQLEREHDAVRELDVPLKALLVFEPLEVEGENVGEFLDLHPEEARSSISPRSWSSKSPSEKAHLFSASCSPLHLSQKNLLRWHSISLALNWRRHDVTDEFGSMSIERSRNDSSRDVTYPLRVCISAPAHRPEGRGGAPFRRSGIAFRS